MSNVKVKAIQIELDGDTITVSIADAKTLWEQLNDIFESKVVKIRDVPLVAPNTSPFTDPTTPFPNQPFKFTS